MTDRSDPFSEIEQLFEQFTQFDDPFGGQIPVDVLDADDELLVRAELPGRDPESISVQLEDNRTLHVEAGLPDAEPEGRYVTRERTTEAVSRSVTLPAAVDESATEATYDRGILSVRLSKLSGDSDGTDIPVN